MAGGTESSNRTEEVEETEETAVGFSNVDFIYKWNEVPSEI